MSAHSTGRAAAGAPVQPPSQGRRPTSARKLLNNLGQMFGLFLGGVLVRPIQDGRLRNVGWPQHLRLIVTIGLGAYLTAVVLVVASPLLRRGIEIGAPSTLAFSMPRGLLWVLLLLVVLSLTFAQTAALHGVWWFRLITTVCTLMVMGAWGLRGASGTSLAPTMICVALMAAVVVFTLMRTSRRFAWWEFAVVLVLIGTAVVIGLLVMAVNERRFGFDFAPQLLAQSFLILGQLAIPAAIAAGTSVAELTVSATLWATRITSAFTFRRTAWWILGGVAAIRLIQSGFEIARVDRWYQDTRTVIASGATIVLLALGTWALLRVARRRQAEAQVSTLPGELQRLSLPIGAALVVSLLPMMVVLGLVQFLIALDPTGQAGRLQFDLSGLGGTEQVITRILVALVLILIAVRAARRGRAEQAVLLGASGGMLLAMTSNFLTRGLLPHASDPTVFNLTATAATFATLAWWGLRRELTTGRALGVAALLVLSGLFAHRDFISDPIGILLGFSGAALVLFGLTWDFLTGSDRGNTGSVKFPLPSRVMLLLGNVVFAVSVLAFASLIRDPSATVDLETFAGFGDAALGTALLIAAFVTVLSATKRAQPVT